MKKAIKNGLYDSEKHFNELPELVQRAVGNAEMIRHWASCDSDEVNTVIMSNFQRTYRSLVSKQEFSERVPETLTQIIEKPTLRIGEAHE